MQRFVWFIACCAVALFLGAPSAFSQGALTPPGAPAPMMKTLDQIEPRIPITNLPWTITAPGSYYIVTNLVGLATAPDGIIVQANDVTIDLRGFVLQGGAGGGNGIAVPAAVTNLHVYNGVIRDWAQSGISATNANNGEMKDLRVSSNGGGGAGGGANIGSGWTVADCQFANNSNGPGLFTGGQATVKSCTSSGNNPGAGFAAGSGSVLIGCTAITNTMGIVLYQGGARVADCTAEGNLGEGFQVCASSSLSGCIAKSNMLNGFNLQWNVRVANCVAEGNAAHGFLTVNSGVAPPPMPRSGCKLTGCTATGNGADGFNVGDASTVENCVATANQNDGIEIGSYCCVLANQCDQNGFPLVGPPVLGAGIKAGNNNRLDGNSVTRNAAAGIDCLVTFANLIVRNSASGNGLGGDYNIGPGNNRAPIQVNPPGILFAANPWDNFSY